MEHSVYRVAGTRTVCDVPPGELLTAADAHAARVNVPALVAAGLLVPVDEHQADAGAPGEQTGTGEQPATGDAARPRRRRTGGEH